MSTTDLNASAVAKELEELEILIEGEPHVTIHIHEKHIIDLTEWNDQNDAEWHGSVAQYVESKDTGEEEIVFIATKLDAMVTAVVVSLNEMKGKPMRVHYYDAQHRVKTGFFVLKEVETLSSHNVMLHFMQLPELVVGLSYSRYRIRQGDWGYIPDEGCVVGRDKPDWHVGVADTGAMSDVKGETTKQIFRHVLQCLKQMAYDPHCGVLTGAGRMAFHSHIQERESHAQPSSPEPSPKRVRRSGSDILHLHSTLSSNDITGL